MTLQINADGAGPMTCSVSTDATGNTFTAMTITTNVPGTNGRSNAANANSPLVASMPAGATCTGTVGTDTNVRESCGAFRIKCSLFSRLLRRREGARGLEGVWLRERRR
jgi:hypothetical protein